MPGRPEIGPAFTVRFDPDLVDRIDAAAAADRLPRAGWLRAAAAEQLDYPRHVLAALAGWMVEHGLAEEVSYALEKPWKHTDYLYAATHGLGILDVEALLADRERLEHEVPAGWAVQHTSPLDSTLTCAHGTVLTDTMAAREHTSAPAACLHGCQEPAAADLHAPATVHAFRRPRRRLAGSATRRR